MVGGQPAVGKGPGKNTMVVQKLPLRAWKLVANSEAAMSKHHKSNLGAHINDNYDRDHHVSPETVPQTLHKNTTPPSIHR